MEPTHNEPAQSTIDLISHDVSTQDTSSKDLPLSQPEQDSESGAERTTLNSPEPSNSTSQEAEEEDVTEEEKPTPCRRLTGFYMRNEFLILVVLVILIAKAYPPLGADYLAKKITAGWIAVIIIFVLASLGMDTKEFSQAFLHVRFNVVVQCYNFGVDSAIVFGVSRGLLAVGALPQTLADGLVICSCLPLSISMVAVLTKCGGGDEASAIFHEAFGNFLGIFLSPALILGYLGVAGSVDLVEVLYKLVLRIVVPVLFGQVLQRFSPAVVTFASKHENLCTRMKQYCLVFIIYTVFCTTFADDSRDADLGHIFVMIGTILVTLIFLMVLSWTTFHLLFRDATKLRVTALFATTHKTIALGIPLITTMYEADPNVGIYTIPLIIWYASQLVIGTLVSPKLKGWVDNEQKRLAQLDSSEAPSCDKSSPSSTFDDQEVDLEALPEQK